MVVLTSGSCPQGIVGYLADPFAPAGQMNAAPDASNVNTRTSFALISNLIDPS